MIVLNVIDDYIESDIAFFGFCFGFQEDMK